MCCFNFQENLTKRTYTNGKIEYYKHKDLHNSKGPALIDGDHKEWWYYGMRHRKNKPAIVYADGSEEWWYYGMRHRKNNKPAVFFVEHSYNITYTNEEYWVYGKRHRSNGPAIIKADGTMEWWRHGKKIKSN